MSAMTVKDVVRYANVIETLAHTAPSSRDAAILAWARDDVMPSMRDAWQGDESLAVKATERRIATLRDILACGDALGELLASKTLAKRADDVKAHLTAIVDGRTLSRATTKPATTKPAAIAPQTAVAPNVSMSDIVAAVVAQLSGNAAPTLSPTHTTHDVTPQLVAHLQNAASILATTPDIMTFGQTWNTLREIVGKALTLTTPTR